MRAQKPTVWIMLAVKKWTQANVIVNRHGKPLVIDMMDADLLSAVTEAVDKIQPNLMQDLLSKKLLRDEK